MSFSFLRTPRPIKCSELIHQRKLRERPFRVLVQIEEIGCTESMWLSTLVFSTLLDILAPYTLPCSLLRLPFPLPFSSWSILMALLTCHFIAMLIPRLPICFLLIIFVKTLYWMCIGTKSSAGPESKLWWGRRKVGTEGEATLRVTLRTISCYHHHHYC